MEDAVSSAVALDVQKAREGDQAAIARLIRQHSTQAYRVAFAILGNQHDAEDVVQEAFIKVFRSLHTVRDERAFRTWVSRITANQANDALRRKCLQRGLPERLQQSGDRVADAPEDIVLRYETSTEVQQAIERLSPLQRATVLLYYSEEFTTKEVAAFLGKPVGSVRRLLSDAYNSLRRLLQAKE
ncbi:MAG TPA: RNA polymerase sigma factor [Symbiobacteriaceae bacterium]|nr:RNA polymerase sigma factor [Symbiobacteriaceae bacterium]